MRAIIGLDLSTQAGLAIFTDDKLTHYETIETDKADYTADYPYNYIDRGEYIVDRIIKVIGDNPFTVLVIEETNQMARDRYAQKQLEFIQNRGPGGGNNNFFPSIDNLVINEQLVQVPEPSVLALFGLGLLSLGVASIKKK